MGRHRAFRRGRSITTRDAGRDRDTSVEISAIVLRLGKERITAAALDYPRKGPVDRYSIEVKGWVVSKEPVAEVEFVHKHSVIARCALSVRRPDVAAKYGSAAEVGFRKALATIGLEPDFTIEVRVVLHDGRRDVIAEIRGQQRLNSPFTPSIQPLMLSTLGRSGGTWMMRMLAEHPDVIVHERFPYETYVCGYWMHFLQVLAAPVDPTLEESFRFWSDPERLPPFPYFSGGPWVHPTPTATADVDHWYFRQFDEFAGVAQAAVESFYHEYASMRKRTVPAFFAEKSVQQKGVRAGHYDWIVRQLYPRGREISLIRDPRDRLASILAFNAKRGFADFGRELVDTDEQLVDVLRADTLDFIQTWKSTAQRGPLLRYEDLIHSPTDQLRTVLDTLELDSSAKVVDRMIRAGSEKNAHVIAHRTTPDASSSIGRWKRDLEPRVQKLCEEKFAGLLDELGGYPS